MLAVSQQISSVAHIVNVLSRDLFELKKQVANSPSLNGGENVTVGPISNNSPSHEDMQRAIATSVSDCHARITEVKRVLDAAKADLSKEIALLETTLSRKIEGNVNKMLNDKITVAMDSYRNSIKDMVLNELQTVGSNTTSAAVAPTPTEPEDFEINVTLSDPGSAVSATNTTNTTKRGGRKASASKAAPANAGRDA